jgi:hypothetical protein
MILGIYVFHDVVVRPKIVPQSPVITEINSKKKLDRFQEIVEDGQTVDQALRKHLIV